MSRKTKLSSLIVVGAILFGLTATSCATPTETPVSSAGTTATAVGDAPEWCGTKPMVVGYNSGNDSNGWRQITLAILKKYVNICPNITKVIYTDARGQAQQQISQFDSLLAQGANVIVTIPEAGQALLPSLRKAMDNGTAVVPFTMPPTGGEAGKDYTVAVVADNVDLGYKWGKWMCQAVNNEGNIVFLGGTPGNSQSAEEFEGAQRAFTENCPNVKFIEPEPVTTNFQVAMYQQAMAGLLAKHEKIDGIIVDFGEGFVGGVTAFKNAGKPIPPVATNSANELACSLMEEKSDFLFYTSGNKQVENALEQGIAAYQGTQAPQKALYPQTVVFDTLNGPQPECAPGLAGGAALGEGLTVEEIKEIIQG